MYGRSITDPRDELVARVVAHEEFTWEESLSGAATGIALGRYSATLDGASWSAIVAGYPYAVVNLVEGETDPGAWPEGIGDAVRGVLREGDDLGLVRARRGDRDIWIALVGRPTARLMPLTKELEPGEELDLRMVEGPELHYSLVSPEGRLQQGSTPARPVLAEQGEWWLELRAESGERVLSVPLYVGLETPIEPLLDLPGLAISNAESGRDEASRLLNEIRAAFDLGELSRDGTLEILAEQPLRLLSEGQWDVETGRERLVAAGFVGEATTQLACRESTVARCLNALMEEPLQRRGILQSDVGVYGIGIEVESSGISMVINLAVR